MDSTRYDLSGRVALVTGGTGGIGKATATELSRLGAAVIVVGRDADRGATAVEEITAASGNGTVRFVAADLSTMAGVSRLASAVRREYDRLDVLVNNAGALSAERLETPDGYERTFATNVLAPFRLTEELRPLLTAAAPARVVNVNTQSADLPWPLASYASFDLADLQSTHGYQGMRAYTRSKTANLLWTFELARRLEGDGISVFAVNPGGADTAMQRESRRAAPLPLRLLFAAALPVMRRVWDLSTERAARSSVIAAAAPELAGETGLYLDPSGSPAAPAAIARDETLAAQLWERLVDMSGVEGAVEASGGAVVTA